MKNYVSTSKLSQISCATLLIGAVFGFTSVAVAAAPSTSGSASTFPSIDTSPSPTSGLPSAQPNQGMSSSDATTIAPPTVPSLTPSLPPGLTSTGQDTTPSLQPPSSGISIPAPPPASALMAPTSATGPAPTGSASGLPVPPTPAALSTDALQLATQAEQAAVQAQAQAETEQAKRDREHIEKSFDRAQNGLLPLAPDQIRSFMHKLEQTQDAAEPPSTGQPKGEVRVATLGLDPGEEPPVVNLAAGYVSTITIVDASGQPWPILDVGVGGNFEVSPTTNGTHIVRIMPLTRFGNGDLSVLLKDLPTPVIFKLAAGGPNVDLRFDARVPKYGPNGKVPLIDHTRMEAGDGDMMSILENSPPKNAKRLKISGLDARTMAWSVDSKVYVRTPLTLLSPAWDSSVSSADGMKVYEIGDAPVLLMSDNGAMLRGRLVQEDDHD